MNCLYCKMDSAARHETDCPLAKTSNNASLVGWVCSLCGRSNSPFNQICPCWQAGNKTNMTIEQIELFFDSELQEILDSE